MLVNASVCSWKLSLKCGLMVMKKSPSTHGPVLQGYKVPTEHEYTLQRNRVAHDACPNRSVLCTVAAYVKLCQPRRLATKSLR